MPPTVGFYAPGASTPIFDGRSALLVSVLKLAAAKRIVSVEPDLVIALDELHRLALAPHHVRVLLVAERADVVSLPLARLFRI